MEDKKWINPNYGIMIVLVFAVFCTLVDYAIIAKKLDESDKVNPTAPVVDNTNKDKTVEPEPEMVITDAMKSSVMLTIEKYYTQIFDYHSSLYCGEVENDASADMIYFKSKTYDSISAIAASFSSVISDNYFENNLKEKFIEKEGSLYCKMNQSSSLEYEKNSFVISSIKGADETIVVQGSYKTMESDLYPSESYNAVISFVNVNDSWVIDSYNEVK